MRKRLENPIGVLLLLVLVIFLSGCTLSARDIITALSGACGRDSLVVTKFEDTNDGICTEDDCSLREAVITANTCAGLQDIDLPAGTYTLSIPGRGEDGSETGDLDILENVNLVGLGGMEDDVVIDGGKIDRVFHFLEPAELEEPHISLIKNLTVTGGMADEIGGGILNDDAVVLVDSVDLEANQAGSEGGVGGAGGGFYVREGRFSTSDFDITDNVAYGPGGGGYFENGSWLANDNQLVAGNQSLGGRGGGGVYFDNGSSADIIDLFIIDNEAAADGGGIWNAGDLDVAREAKFGINVVGQRGGGLYNEAGGVATFNISWFVNNAAEEGGGIYNLGSLELFESGVDSNTASGGLGGGIVNEGSGANLNLRNVTISRNLLEPSGESGGGGLFNERGEVQMSYSTVAYQNADGLRNLGGVVTIRNSIVAHHAGGRNCTGDPVTSAGFNLEDHDSCGFLESSDVEADPVGIEFLAKNGGFSNNHALAADSPALNSASRAACPSVDQRGVIRPQGEHCDRGAFESKEFAGAGSDTMGATDAPAKTPTATLTPSVTPTPTVSVTPTLQEPTGELDQNAFCRTGPGTVYPPATAYEAGTTLVIDGQNNFDPRWWRVVVPSTGGHCWISDSLLSTTGAVEEVPEYQAPPTPTPTPVAPTVTPTYQQ